MGIPTLSPAHAAPQVRKDAAAEVTALGAGGGGTVASGSLPAQLSFSLDFQGVSRRYSHLLGYLFIYPVAYLLIYSFVYLLGYLLPFNCNTFPRRKVPFRKSVCRKAKLKFVGKGSESEAALLVNSHPVWYISFWNNNNNKLRVLRWVPVCIVNISLALTHI